MKAALLILALSAVAYAGPAFNKNNQIEADKVQQHQQYMTQATGEWKQTQAIETLKDWCFASQMSQPELTSSFKKLVGLVKSSPEDQSTESAVMSGRMCQGAIVQKSAQTGQTVAQNGADAQAHELIKDVYMDALIACESRECMQQLLKIINSQQVDTIRASYYMTRIAVSDKESIKEGVEIKQLAESFLKSPMQSGSEAVERQKLLAVTATIGKSLKQQQQQPQQAEIRQIAEQVVKTIVDRYIKPVSQQEVQQYQEQPAEQQSAQLIKKIAKRSAALKALANIPGYVIKETATEVEQILVELAQNKDELSTVRQSAIECLEQNDKVTKQLKQITFDQQEPTEVRIAAYRALMTSLYAGQMKDEQNKQQAAAELVTELIKHCEEPRNQQQDEQFVMYVISHLDNMRATQQPEYEAIKECITKSKQNYMQIQVLCKKFKQQLNDIRKSSRNYKLEQEFNQLESGLIIDGDIIYESKQKQSQPIELLPKLVRVNMSMPVMGETVNVVEVTLRQNQMDEQLLSALNLVQNAKFSSESMSMIVDSFKQSVEQQQQQQKQQQQQQQQQQQRTTKTQHADEPTEADLTIKVDGCTVVYLSVDDFKTESQQTGHARITRSIVEANVDSIIEHLKRHPIAFNRGFNFNLNERLAKVLDVEANIIAGLRFESRVQGSSADDFEVVAQIEPRFGFESIVGPAKVSSKKLLQRVSTKTALGLRYRYKNNEIVDVQIDLPMNTMELFTIETQMVEQSRSVPSSYTYLANSIYGQEDIYSSDEFVRSANRFETDDTGVDQPSYYQNQQAIRKVKRSIFEKPSTGKSLVKLIQGKQTTFAHSLETSEQVARATGLRGKLRVVASPADMSLLVQAVAQKYEPQMQGYRVQLQKVASGSRNAQQQLFTVTLSTPGSRFERTTQLRVMQQTGPQRTVIKSNVQSPKMGASIQLELTHDARQYAVKAEIASTRGKQWRHAFECGVQRGSASQSGRIAATYKPYVSVDSTSLKRPIQMQAVVGYQQEPKTVISYELKSPNSDSFLQGKIVVDERNSPAFASKRAQWQRRSMQSPIEYMLRNDVTLSAEIAGQVGEHSLKMHQMLDWDSSKWALQADSSVQHKNVRKSHETQVTGMLKLDKDQQMVTVQRRSPQNERQEFRATLVSDCKSPNAHQLVAEVRYNAKRQSNLNEIVAYKHKIDYNQWSQSKLDLGVQVELVASEKQLNEKLSGRTQLIFERSQKKIQAELSSRAKSAKFDMDWTSAEQHKIELQMQAERIGQHRTLVRSTPSELSVQCRTDKHNGQMIHKIVVEFQKPKQSNKGECQVLVEVPAKATHVAVDLKLTPGKPSSWALQTPRFASKAEFSFETLSRPLSGKRWPMWKQPMLSLSNMRFKTDLKDLQSQEAYWLDSTYDDSKPWYVRANSPVYRADYEFDPREFNSKLGLFARSKRSVGQFEQIYSNDDSILAANKLAKLDWSPSKLWAIRSIVNNLPLDANKSLKQKAISALFEFADARQAHKHSFQFNPIEQRLNFNMDAASQQQSWKPMRFAGDLATNFIGGQQKQQQQQQQQRPCAISMESEWADFDINAKPFDGQESFAKINLLSRHRRSPVKKHESEYRYSKDHGYKAWMKQQDADDKHHSWTLEADDEPQKWTKMEMDSDKHGKAKWEHKWRKNANKRSLNKRSIVDDMTSGSDVYANEVGFELESPAKQLSHRTQLSWEEPIEASQMWQSSKKSRYGLADYLKHVNGRLNSRHHKQQQQLYNVDFDYQPQASFARLNMDMPEQMSHSSSFEFEPTERVYKLQSRLFNRRTNEPTYDMLASTKPYGLASQDQEPVFFADSHPMLERPINSGLFSAIFKQPIKVDYSDRLGRTARLDYDQSPLVSDAAKFAGLRQKRAAFYYKDQSNDFEHESNFDFYPEIMIGGFKSSKAQRQSNPADLTTFKTQTKYGPVVVQVDSSDNGAELKLKSPVANVKLSAETLGKRVGGAKLVKLAIDNQDQRVSFDKLVRQSPILNKCQLAKEAAKQLDKSRFEHETELLVSIVDAIFKLKSQTLQDKRPVMSIEGEFNQPQQKLVVKLDGKRTDAQLLVDLVTKSAELVLSVDDKRTIQHQTRLVKLNDKYFSLESVTSHKQQPLYKLSAKISAQIFEEPAHFFAKRQTYHDVQEHISTFDATIYEPKPIQVSGQFDCVKNEARIITKDLYSKKTQQTQLIWDERSKTFVVNANLSGPSGPIYTTKANINFIGFTQPNRCHGQTCRSEIFHQCQKTGNIWAAKLVPGDLISVETPYGKQAINWSY